MKSCIAYPFIYIIFKSFILATKYKIYTHFSVNVNKMHISYVYKSQLF